MVTTVPAEQRRRVELADQLRVHGANVSSYRTADLVLDPATDPPRAGILCAGSATVWRLSPRGKQLAVASLTAGEWFENLFPASRSDRTYIEADSAVKVAWLQPADFERLLHRQPKFALDLLRLQVRRLHSTETRASQTALDNMAGSVALAILQMAERQGSTEISVTHEELAQRLGTVRESVSLAVRTLRRAGVVAPAGRRKRLISVLSLSELYRFVGLPARGV